MAAISGSSVETMICEKQPESWAAAMLWAIMGLPLKGLMFLRGMRLLPPRAGMMQRGMVESLGWEGVVNGVLATLNFVSGCLNGVDVAELRFRLPKWGGRCGKRLRLGSLKKGLCFVASVGCGLTVLLFRLHQAFEAA